MKKVEIYFIDGLRDHDPIIWKDGFMYRADLPPGSAQWAVGEDMRHLYYTCPCGCGNVGPLPIVGGKLKDGWKWNGNEAKPSTTPSIQKVTPCRWHGYLTDGVFTPC